MEQPQDAQEENESLQQRFTNVDKETRVWSVEMRHFGQGDVIYRQRYLGSIRPVS